MNSVNVDGTGTIYDSVSRFKRGDLLVDREGNAYIVVFFNGRKWAILLDTGCDVEPTKEFRKLDIN
jgi:hypothetical protein